MEKVIDLKDLKSFEKQYDSEKIFRVSSNSVKKNGVFNASFNDTILNTQYLLDMIIASYKLSAHKIKLPYKLHIVCRKEDDFSLNKIGEYM